MEFILRFISIPFHYLIFNILQFTYIRLYKCTRIRNCTRRALGFQSSRVSSSKALNERFVSSPATRSEHELKRTKKKVHVPWPIKPLCSCQQLYDQAETRRLRERSVERRAWPGREIGGSYLGRWRDRDDDRESKSGASGPEMIASPIFRCKAFLIRFVRANHAWRIAC